MSVLEVWNMDWVALHTIVGNQILFVISFDQCVEQGNVGMRDLQVANIFRFENEDEDQFLA